MFRHDDKPAAPIAASAEAPVSTASSAPAPEKPVVKTESQEIKELLEKNLKWSQIIYEQNRKINRKLLWTAIAEWTRFFIIIVLPILLALWFVPRYLADFEKKYASIANPGQSNFSTTTIDQLINLLPVSSENKDQIKSKLK